MLYRYVGPQVCVVRTEIYSQRRRFHRYNEVEKRQRRATLGSLGGMRNQRVNFYQQLHLPIGPSRKYTLLICFVLLTQPTHVQRPLVIWIIALLLLMIPNQMSNGWIACCCIGTQTRVPTKPLYLEFSPSMNFAMSKSRYRSRRLAHPLIRFICW